MDNLSLRIQASRTVSRPLRVVDRYTLRSSTYRRHPRNTTSERIAEALDVYLAQD